MRDGDTNLLSAVAQAQIAMHFVKYLFYVFVLLWLSWSGLPAITYWVQLITGIFKGGAQ